MNYYQIGEQTMSIFKNMFSSVEKVTVSACTGFLSLYAPVCIPIIALAGVIIVGSIYDCRSNKKETGVDTAVRCSKKIFYKLRDSIVAICGAFTIERFIVTSINLHAVEFVAGAIVLVEFCELLKNLGRLHPEWKIWNILRKVIKKKGEKFLDIELDKELPDDNDNV